MLGRRETGRIVAGGWFCVTSDVRIRMTATDDRCLCVENDAGGV